MTKSSSAAESAFWRADWLVDLLVIVAVPVLTLATDATARSIFAALADTASAANAVTKSDRTLIGQRGAAPPPPGYDPGAQAADDEGERAARTIAFNTQAVPGTVATPHEQSDGSAQTGKT